MRQIDEKMKMAIKRLKEFQPEEGYFVAFSGGKDSQCIYHLCEMAGVKFDAHYNVASVDPPELVRFIRDKYPQVSMEIPHDKDGKPITMWNLIPKEKIPPTRRMRYCCEHLKEKAGVGRLTVTGVRWEESTNRANNHGEITIPKAGVRLKKKLEDEGVNFQRTDKGGGDEHGQRRVKEDGGAMLQDEKNAAQSNCRLVGKRCLVIPERSAAGRKLRALHGRMGKDWVYRMPARGGKSLARIWALAEVQGFVPERI